MAKEILNPERILIVFVAAFLAACNVGREDAGYNSSVLVDLGEGNGEVAQQYQNFQVNCKDADVVVTSFSGYGDQANVSRAGMEAFEKSNALGQTAKDSEPAGKAEASEKVKTSEQSTSGAETVPTTTTAADSTATTTASGITTDNPAAIGFDLQGAGTYTGGATTRQQTIDVDGKPTKICFATLPVNYSSAPLAHKIVQESGAKRVINMGESSQARVEAGATNYIVADKVYDFNGKEIDQKSSSPRVVEGYIEDGKLVPLSQTASVDSTWDKKQVSEATGIKAEAGARDDSQYFCNALTYVLANSITSQKTQAYSPSVNLPPLSKDIEQGFLHVDRDAGPEKVEKALANILRMPGRTSRD